MRRETAIQEKVQTPSFGPKVDEKSIIRRVSIADEGENFRRPSADGFVRGQAVVVDIHGTGGGEVFEGGFEIDRCGRR